MSVGSRPFAQHRGRRLEIRRASGPNLIPAAGAERSESAAFAGFLDGSKTGVATVSSLQVGQAGPEPALLSPVDHDSSQFQVVTVASPSQARPRSASIPGHPALVGIQPPAWASCSTGRHGRPANHRGKRINRTTSLGGAEKFRCAKIFFRKYA